MLERMHEVDQYTSPSGLKFDRDDQNHSFTSFPSRQSETAGWLLQQPCPTGSAYTYPQSFELSSGCIDPRGLNTAFDNFGSLPEGSPGISPFGLKSQREATPYTPSSTPEPQLCTRAMTASPSGEDDTDARLPYNRLLYNCFLSMPDHEALLKDIYEWFEKNTDKARSPGQKGWQNSIRHNLSMNEAFVRGSRRTPHSVPNNNWMLSDAAVHNGGVEPTTRFRNHQRNPTRARNLHDPYPQRQITGRKRLRTAAGRRACLQSTRKWMSDSDSPSPIGFCDSVRTRPTTPFDQDQIDLTQQAGGLQYPNLCYVNGAGSAIPCDQGNNDATPQFDLNSLYACNVAASAPPLYSGFPNMDCSLQHGQSMATEMNLVNPGIGCFGAPSSHPNSSREQWMPAEYPRPLSLSPTLCSNTPSLTNIPHKGGTTSTSAGKCTELELSDSSIGVPNTPDQPGGELFGPEFFDVGKVVESCEALQENA